jgi:hypothetical protein
MTHATVHLALRNSYSLILKPPGGLSIFREETAKGWTLPYSVLIFVFFADIFLPHNPSPNLTRCPNPAKT